MRRIYAMLPNFSSSGRAASGPPLNMALGVMSKASESASMHTTSVLVGSVIRRPREKEISVAAQSHASAAVHIKWLSSSTANANADAGGNHYSKRSRNAGAVSGLVTSRANGHALMAPNFSSSGRVSALRAELRRSTSR